MPTPARYYDGLTAEVIEAGAKPGLGELLIYRPGDYSIVARWPIADVMVMGDAEHEAAPFLALRGSDARLVIPDWEMRRQISAAAPQLAGLAAARPAAGKRVAQFGASVLVLLALFWGGIELGSEVAAPLVPHAWQAKLGSEVRDQLVAGHTLCTGEAGLAAINNLANRLARAADYKRPITVEIVKGGPINAFTLPGGRLIFYSDLINGAKDGSQVAGVLAHEIGHVVHDHAIKGLVRQYGLNTLLGLLTGGYSEISTLATGGGLLLALRNGRAFERDSDATGVALLEKLGLRADGISTFFGDLMGQDKTDMATAAGIWSSHPPTAERIAATKRPATGRPPFSDAEWRALRSVCDGAPSDGVRQRRPPDSLRNKKE